MSIITEFSRLIFKRSTTEAEVPSIPSTSSLDDTWNSTDIYVGEAFINVFNERLFIRCTDRIVEVPTSGYGLKASTTDATVTTVESIDVPDDSAMMVEAEVMAIQSDGSKAANVFLRGLYKNDGGTLSSVGSLTQNVTSDFTTLTADLSASGTDATIRITGEAATDIEWSIKYKLAIVNV